MMELTKPSLLVRRRLEHALQRWFGDLGEGRANFRLLRWRYPRGLDRRYPGLTDAAQQRFAQVGIFHGRGGVIVQTAANAFGMRPAPDHMGRAKAHELAARVGHFEQ